MNQNVPMKEPAAVFFLCRTEWQKDQITGGTRSNIMIMKSLSGFKPFVITNKVDRLTDELNRHFIEYEVVAGDYPWSYFRDKSLVQKISVLLSLVLYNLKILFKLITINPEVVNCDDVSVFMILIAAKLTRKKLIIHLRNYPYRPTLRLIDKLPLYLSDAIVPISRELGQYYLDNTHNKIRNKLYHIYNSIDLEEIDSYKKKYNRKYCRELLRIDDGEIAIGIIGLIGERKRQREFLSEVAVCLNDKNVGVYLIGGITDMEYYNKCKDIVDSHNMKYVHFTGYTEDVYCWYQALDIVCLPSSKEGLGRVLVEAAACERPTIAFNISGPREAILDGVSGYCVNDWQDFKERVFTLMDNEELRASFGRNGLAHISNKFDVRINTIEIEKIFTELIS